MRVCVVDSPELGRAYPRLAECAIECMAVVPSIDEVDPRLLVEHEAVLVACSDHELADPSFQLSAARIARQLPTIALVTAGADAGIAARLGFRGLLDRDVSPAALERTVRAVLSGELAFPRSSQFSSATSHGARLSTPQHSLRNARVSAGLAPPSAVRPAANGTRDHTL